jgi:hypothetical protein
LKSRTTKRFRDAFTRLPSEIKKRARDAYELFQHDPGHPSLRFKRLHGTEQEIYSARITRDYRAVGVRDEDTIIWFWIGSHADYERLLSNLS